MDCLLTDLYWINASISRTVENSFFLILFTKIICNNNNRYASDTMHATQSEIFGAGRVSNAPIESFFKILKHSILRHETNLRPAQFLLKVYSTTNARLKANKYNVQQSGSKKRGRSTKKPA